MSDQQQLDRQIGRILRYGVLVAASFMVIGLALTWQEHLPISLHCHALPRQFVTIVSDVYHCRPDGFLLAGLLLLILTPILRVITSLIAFARQRDWQYVIITFIVLIILGLAALVSHH